MIAYEGSENYIFVSYAHKDSDRVIPIIDALDAAGFRIWYDSGIEVGSEWPEYIEDRLLNSSRVIVFMTPSCVASPNCRNEINLARSQNKEMLIVYLEPTKLIKGMNLQLNSVQAINAQLHPTIEALVAALARGHILQCCRVGWEDDNATADEPSAKKNPTKLTGSTETATATVPSLSSLVKRAFICLEDGERDRAIDLCEQILNHDPECAEAYLCKLMAELKVKKQEELKDLAKPFDSSINYQKTLRFGDEKLRSALVGYVEHINARNENARLDAIYTRAKSDMSSANTEKAYIAAAQLFESIREYLNSSSLAEACYASAKEIKRLAEEEKKKCERLIDEYKVAVQSERSGVDQKAEASARLSLLEEDHADLVNFKNNWHSTDKQLSSLNERSKSIKAEISSLRSESSKLGFLAGRRKKEIAERLAVLESDQSSLTADIASLQAKKQGYDSISEVEDKIAITLLQIEQQKKTLEILSHARSAQAIREELSSLESGRRLLQRFDSLQNARKGQYITFGAYGQYNCKEDIEWLVLEVKDRKALVISKYALDCKPYNTSRAYFTWETCTLREWLNKDFINSAFSDSEKAMIPTVTVSADRNPAHSANPGKATQDRVFLLSITEANKYCGSNNARLCAPTAYAVASGACVYSENGNCCWWLRSPGFDQSYAVYVSQAGVIVDFGRGVSDAGYAVRPAMWIDLDA